ncbi:MAG: nucleotidyltransferase family protein [Calditrichaeota bacterium]|nr:nucleotidyltransferase family protein [Calditrichota bacterium]
MSSSGIHTAMILAAGFGSRMGDLTKRLPKPLLPLGDWTVIDIILMQLKRAGFSRIVINLHYRAEQIKKHLRERRIDDLELIFSEEMEILGTGGGIARAEPFFPDSDVLVLNSDILSDLSLTQFINFHQTKQSFASMAVWPSDNFKDYALVKFNRNFRLAGFCKRGIRDNSPYASGIYTGHQILSTSARKYLREKPSSVIETLYRPAMDDNRPIHIFIHDGFYIDLGTKNQYLDLCEKINNGIIDPKSFF